MDVVRWTIDERGICCIEIDDPGNKNMFSSGVIQGLCDAFDHLTAIDTCKVVVLYGVGNYFLTGGTRSILEQINAREITFADLDMYRRIVDCELPTIAAVQGHAIGGGFNIACAADLMVLAEEAYYCANFMNFGITPGMGASFFIPLRMGQALGDEMIYTGRNYRGRELRDRGIGSQVVSAPVVVETAMRLARNIAEKPRDMLVAFKKHQARRIRAMFDEVIEEELALHKLHLASEETQKRIEDIFDTHSFQQPNVTKPESN